MGVRELWLVDTGTKEVEVRSFEVSKTAIYNLTRVIRSKVLTKTRVRVASIFQHI